MRSNAFQVPVVSEVIFWVLWILVLSLKLNRAIFLCFSCHYKVQTVKTLVENYSVNMVYL